MTNADRSKRRARSAAFFWALFLLTLTSWPRPPVVPIVSAIPHFDKFVHFVLYGVQAFLLYRAVAWPGEPEFSLWRVIAIVGVMAVWAVADEVHQYWIPGRSMEGADVMADVIGGTVGAAMASALTARSAALVIPKESASLVIPRERSDRGT